MKQAKILRGALEQSFRDDSSMTWLLVALGRRTAIGTTESGATPIATSWNEAKHSQNRPELAAALKGALRKAAQEAGLDTNRSGVAVLAVRRGDGLDVRIVAVTLGSVEAGQWVSFDASTEKEWFAIANGPHPQVWPHKKMAQPIGVAVEVPPAGAVGRRVEMVPEKRTWITAPLPWSELPGIAPDLEFQCTVSSLDGITRALAGPGSEHRLLQDPVAIALADAVCILPPTLTAIKRHGVEDGLYDRYGTKHEPASGTH